MRVPLFYMQGACAATHKPPFIYRYSSETTYQGPWPHLSQWRTYERIGYTEPGADPHGD